MAGLLDFLAGNGVDPTDPDAVARARANQGLLGFAAGLLSQGASRTPIPFGQPFGLGLQGMLGAQQSFDNQQKTRAETGLLGANTAKATMEQKLLQARIDAMRQGQNDPFPGLIAPANPTAAASNANAETNAAPTDATSALGLIKQFESGGNYNAGWGGADLSKAPLGPDGFPQWSGAPGPQGPSHAAGAYQFEPGTWAHYAQPLGIHDFSPQSQDKVAAAAYADQGFSPWAPYNPKLAAAVQAQGAAPQRAAMPAPAAPTASSAPTIPGMPAGMQISPAAVSWAQRQTMNARYSGLPVPDWINQLAAYPMIGPTAAAKAGAQYPFDIGKINAQADADVRKAGPIAGAKKKAELPYTFGRPGAMLPQVDAAGNPTGQFLAVPQLQQVTDPATGQKSYAYLSPQGVRPTGQVAGLGPGQTKTLENNAAVQPLTFQTPITKSGPGYTEPLKSDAGTTIPPATAATPIQGPKEYLDERAKEYSKVESAWGDSVQSAAEAQQRMTAIMSALKQYQSGAFASDLSNVRAGLKAVGLNLPDAVAGNPAQAEIILKNNFAAAIQTMKATGLSRWTQAELFSSQKNMANPDLQPEANLAIGAQTIGTLQWEQQMQRDYAQAKQYGGFLDPQDFQRQWAQANPLQAFVDRAEQQIGPLKGMPQPGPKPAPGLAPNIAPDFTATGPGGHKIMRVQGRWYDAITRQPVGK